MQYSLKEQLTRMKVLMGQKINESDLIKEQSDPEGFDASKKKCRVKCRGTETSEGEKGVIVLDSNKEEAFCSENKELGTFFGGFSQQKYANVYADDNTKYLVEPEKIYCIQSEQNNTSQGTQVPEPVIEPADKHPEGYVGVYDKDDSIFYDKKQTKYTKACPTVCKEDAKIFDSTGKDTGKICKAGEKIGIYDSYSGGNNEARTWANFSLVNMLEDGKFNYIYTSALKCEEKGTSNNSGQGTVPPKPRCPSGQRYCWGECLDSTGFKNEEEGNKFREWVNSKYPDYAKEIQLDPAGKFNNCYIRKAWKKYGEEYKNQSGDVKKDEPKVDDQKKDEPAVKKNPYLNRKPEAGTESD